MNVYKHRLLQIQDMTSDPESKFYFFNVSNAIEDTNLSLTANHGESDCTQYSGSDWFADIDSIPSYEVIDSLESIWGDIERSGCSYNCHSDNNTTSIEEMNTLRITDGLDSLEEVVRDLDSSFSEILNNSSDRTSETANIEEFEMDADGTIGSMEAVWGDSECTSDDDSLAVNVGEGYTDYSDIDEIEDRLYVEMCSRVGLFHN